jgi:hypothetical protein
LTCKGLRLDSSCGVLDLEVLAGGVHVLVSSSTAAHHHPHTVGQGRAELLEVGEGVGGLQGGDDALQTRDALESCNPVSSDGVNAELRNQDIISC